MPGHTTRIKICVLMAGIAAHAPNSKAIGASNYRWLVQAARITLTRRSAGGMTIDATRMGEHLAQFGEIGSGPLLWILDRRETLGRSEGSPAIGRRWASSTSIHGVDKKCEQYNSQDRRAPVHLEPSFRYLPGSERTTARTAS
jgi:hypothetical protein